MEKNEYHKEETSNTMQSSMKQTTNKRHASTEEPKLGKPLLNKENTSTRKGKLCKWLSGTNFLLYCSHGLSAWGDRMWQFAVGMFLVALNPESLRLTAIYGFASGGAILLLGAIVGNWVDKYPRFTVARTSLIIANMAVATSAGTVCAAVWFEEILLTAWGGWLQTMLEIIIITSAVVADVASIGRTISIERDWIVVICEDTESLTNMSAFLRRLDLLTNLAAPIVTGQVITFGSMFIGAIFIAAWNIISMGVEYVLLLAVYNSVPALATKKIEGTNEHVDGEKSALLSGDEQSCRYGLVDSNETAPQSKHTHEEENRDVGTNSASCFTLFFDSFIILRRGWKTYIDQPIMLAGLGLATLYMTVLGFDNITTGFAKEQGLSESLISILLATGSVMGVFGTVLFPILRGRVGLQRTGLLANTVQLCCLSLCLASVFTPGSPFDPDFLLSVKENQIGGNLTQHIENNALHLAAANRFGNDFTSYDSLLMVGLAGNDVRDHANEDNVKVTDVGNLLSSTNKTDHDDKQMNSQGNISIILLMVGIVLSRTGLWMFDLTVTQLLLETPQESERGIVNGVQNSINRLMDIVKSILVIFLPWPQTFGYLIILSFAFVTMGGILYACYSRKVRGHLFHFEDYQKQTESLRYPDPELKSIQPMTV